MKSQWRLVDLYIPIFCLKYYGGINDFRFYVCTSDSNCWIRFFSLILFSFIYQTRMLTKSDGYDPLSVRVNSNSILFFNFVKHSFIFDYTVILYI